LENGHGALSKVTVDTFKWIIYSSKFDGL